MDAHWVVPLLEMELLDVLSLTAIGTTLGMFLCGVPICLGIRRRGSTEGVSAAPFLVATTSCAFWTRYGFLKDDASLVTVNGLGLALQAAYLLYYHSRTRVGRSGLNKAVGLVGLAVGLMLLYVRRLEASGQRPLATERLGLACVLLNVANFSAPLAGLRDVFRLRSTENLPFPLCLANLLVSLQWLLYGALVEDFYIQVPNYAGIALSLLQLSLFLRFPSRPRYDQKPLIA